MAPNNNQTNAQFISEVRRILRDQPVYYGESQPTDGTTGALTAGSKPFRLQRAPVINAGVVLTAPGGAPGWTVDYDDVVAPVANHVNIVTETGELVFNPAPPLGTLAVTYQAVRYSDKQILDALTDGLNLLWPEIWNPSVNTTSIMVSPTQYEYALPAVFQDQRAILRTVEYAPPSGIVRYYQTSLWRVVEDTVAPLLAFSKVPPIASQIRLGYVVPLANLQETPTIAQNLPVYYALARLLIDQETMRGRSDDQPALTGEGATPAGTATNTSLVWMQQFSTQLTRLGMAEPARRTVIGRAVERLGLSEFWNSA
jgi:hypothetical protein